ncbi:hypothetical protein NSZ01_31880 [Nocardioides szechwanensis]|nr:hypothetical protein NSZ01_31880 [Nocardioides szechwanensis]
MHARLDRKLVVHRDLQQIACACSQQRTGDLLAVGPGIDALAAEVDRHRSSSQTRGNDPATGDAARPLGGRDRGRIGPDQRERSGVGRTGGDAANGSDSDQTDGPVENGASRQ